ncbi:VOC family protein [Phenylobacterium sp.]|jgi:catechol 2,3-dioxygenase-like lactoylglutathione lyase family enzyme|uniref:VOC family protein n=1 Tax=Phenylobacterium sp. TaxID=1871053 RepID=UPI002E2F8EF9|nr:VOC family protein [Phenylobacterium sp.]HEX4710809.1 VOC family protein [Phenylobacterium sp.]
MTGQTNHSAGPRRTTWTHIAFAVRDIDASIAWYEKFTHLRLLARGEDKDGKNAWLGDPAQSEAPFVLVLGQFYEGHDPFAPAVHPPMGPFAHIGIEAPTKQDVDDIAARAKAEGSLAFGPVQMPKQIGYVCFIKDPDGNTIEYSHDQGVYETAREVWGKKTAPV